MIANRKPYPKYKESGSPWLGAVPINWEIRNLRTLIRPRNERNRSDLPLLSVAREKGVFVRSLTDADENHNVIPDDLSNYKVARAGALVINKMKAWQGSMGIAPCDGIVSPAYFVFDFGISSRAFGQVLLRSKPYVAHFAQASEWTDGPGHPGKAEGDCAAQRAEAGDYSPCGHPRYQPISATQAIEHLVAR
jgi:type I restriction enzyme, S subunit